MRVDDVEPPISLFDYVVSQGHSDERHRHSECTPGAREHDGVLQPKHSPASVHGLPEPAVEIQLLPHPLLNYDEIRVGSLSSGLFSAHQVAPLLPFVRPGSSSLGGRRCGLRCGGWFGLRRRLRRRLRHSSGGRCGQVGGALSPGLFERRYLGFGSGSSRRFQRAAHIGEVISHAYTTRPRAARG